MGLHFCLLSYLCDLLGIGMPLHSSYQYITSRTAVLRHLLVKYACRVMYSCILCCFWKPLSRSLSRTHFPTPWILACKADIGTCIRTQVRTYDVSMAKCFKGAMKLKYKFGSLKRLLFSVAMIPVLTHTLDK